MKPRAPLLGAAETSAWHGGNAYRGPGAWHRSGKMTSTKRHRGNDVPLNALHSPLDLTSIPNLGFEKRTIYSKSRCVSQDKKRLRRGKAAALASRLESLSLLRAPSDGIDAVACAPIATIPTSVRHTRPQYLSLVQHRPSPAVLDARDASHAKSGPVLPLCAKPAAAAFDHSARRPVPESNDVCLKRQRWRLGKGRTSVDTLSKDEFPRVFTQEKPKNPAPDWIDTNELRKPSAPVKMAVDDMCNAQALDARTTLRVLLEEQTALAAAMRQRRHKACLGSASGRRKRVRNAASHQLGQQRRFGEQQENAKGSAKHEGRPSALMNPLSFMTERDLQNLERDFMRLEDAAATHLSKLEEAVQRKEDYGAYYGLALRYGPLSPSDFSVAAYPGKLYHSTISDAARVVQNWWWSTWPPVLRSRKAAALSIQSAFRGFRQRKQWHAIIRLRTIWSTTRIVAHAFVCWRDSLAKVRRVNKFVRRFHARCSRRCFLVWASHAAAERKNKEDVIRRRLKKVKEGLRLRLFEAWVQYTETSLAIERMRRRTCMQPVLKAWHQRASADRVHNQLRLACATIVSRMLRFRERTMFLKYRRACCKIQRSARRRIARVRLRNETAASRTSRAEEMVQLREDERLDMLLEVEQDRRDRLRARIDDNMLRIEKSASAFLRTPAGKSAVHDLQRDNKRVRKEKDTIVAGTKTTATGYVLRPSRATEGEARNEVVHRFVLREKASVRHDFNAEWPPPLRCFRADCDATFVDPGHYARHAADIHPEDNPRIAKLSLALIEPTTREMFQVMLDTSKTSSGDANDDEVCTDSRRAKFSVHEEDDRAIRRKFELWNAIERWQTVQSSSGRYQQLAAAAYDILALVPNGVRDSTPGSSDRKRNLLSFGGGRWLLKPVDERQIPFHSGSWSTAASAEGEGLYFDTTGVENKNEPNGRSFGYVVDPLALEAASAQALSDLSEAVGPQFLASKSYLKYLENTRKSWVDAVADKVSDITARERVEWLEEARVLRAAKFNHNETVKIENMAEEAVTLALGVQEDIRGVLGLLIDDQAALLAVVIIAERSAFAKVILAVWNEALDEVARLHCREQRKVSSEIAGSVTEVVCSITRSLLVDGLIDQCVEDLTKPGGEMWPDERAAVAVADGLAYRVRGDIMEEILETSFAELWDSGEAERLVSEAAEQRVAETNDIGMERKVEAAVGANADGREVGIPLLLENSARGEGTSPDPENHGQGDVDRMSSGEMVMTEMILRESKLSQPSGEGSSMAEETGKTQRSMDDDSGDEDKIGVSAQHPASETKLRQRRETRRANDDESSGDTGSTAAAVAVAAGKRSASMKNMSVSNEGDELATSTALVVRSADGWGGVFDLHDSETVPACSSSSTITVTDGDGSEYDDTSKTITSVSDERAAIMMQSAMRRKVVYRETKALIARNYVKLYDPGSAHFYWYNQTSGESTWEKPAIIDFYFKKTGGTAVVKAIDHFAALRIGTGQPQPQ